MSVHYYWTEFNNPQPQKEQMDKLFSKLYWPCLFLAIGTTAWHWNATAALIVAALLLGMLEFEIISNTVALIIETTVILSNFVPWWLTLAVALIGFCSWLLNWRYGLLQPIDAFDPHAPSPKKK
jgi:hypothetical protein